MLTVTPPNNVVRAGPHEVGKSTTGLVLFWGTSGIAEPNRVRAIACGPSVLARAARPACPADGILGCERPTVPMHRYAAALRELALTCAMQRAAILASA